MNQYRNNEGTTVEAVETWRVIAWARYDWDKVPEWLRLLYGEAAVIFTPDSVILPVGKQMITAERHDWITYDPATEFVEVYTPEAFTAFEKVSA
jgi:hypothetical protein